MIENNPIFSRRIPNLNKSDASLPAEQTISPIRTLVFVLLHVPLGLVLRGNSLVSTAHALFILALGLFFLLRDHQPARMIYVAAYIAGMEVLWRASGAHIFWETGKYAVSALLLVALFKYGRGQKIARWPVFYFVLLLPSIFTMPYFDREAIAFNLAGPFALAVAVMFFSMIRIDLDVFKRVMIAMLAPTVALGVYVLSGIVSIQNIAFSNNSNFQTSGDYGPNQVSIILALGALAAIYYALVEHRLFYRYLFLGLGLWLMVQSVLTFSRSGLWTTGLTVFVTGLYLIRDSRRLVGFIVASLFVGLVAYYFIFPFLDTFTGNTLSARFANLESTGRLEIAQADLIIFSQFPVLGVGPGQSDALHALTFRFSNAHTEYSRMLAEHGSFGLLALLLLLLAVFGRAMAKTDSFSKGFLLGFTVWALLFMVSAATRQVAPSYLFGLAAATFDLQKKNVSEIH